MTVILTSDFPLTEHAAVVERMRSTASRPRIAWIPPFTGAQDFAAAGEPFATLGFDALEYCDIDRDADQVQLAYLHEFDVVYLADGDPIRFRYNALRTGLAGRLRQCMASGRLIVAAGGGAMLLTPNVSAWRLTVEPVVEVLGDYPRLDGIGMVSFELMPHWNRFDTEIHERVGRYAEGIDHDIVTLPDGGALLARDAHSFERVENLK
jgi:peptidase E